MGNWLVCVTYHPVFPAALDTADRGHSRPGTRLTWQIQNCRLARLQPANQPELSATRLPGQLFQSCDHNQWNIVSSSSSSTIFLLSKCPQNCTFRKAGENYKPGMRFDLLYVWLVTEGRQGRRWSVVYFHNFDK